MRMAPPNEFTIELRELYNPDYRAVIHLHAATERELLSKLACDLAFEERRLHAHRWVASNRLAAVITTQV